MGKEIMIHKYMEIIHSIFALVFGSQVNDVAPVHFFSGWLWINTIDVFSLTL